MISYQTDGIEMPAIKKRETTEMDQSRCRHLQQENREISLHLLFGRENPRSEPPVPSARLLHGHHHFDYCEGNRLSGDLFISLDTVRTNAEQFAGNDYERELYRVIIHGILHLCGINDKGPGEREIMEAAENKALAMR